MKFFEKDINKIKKEDIDEIVHLEVQENDSIEFKKTLSTERGNSDGWIEGKNKVGKFAKAKIVKEVIAFANADGGYVLIGIDEKQSDEGTNKASNLYEIPRVELLAEKFKLYLRDLIEPRINNVQCLGIPTDDKDNGVLLIYVERSNNAPHRSTLDNQCYIRRNDRSEKLTMREIKDLILLRQHSIEEVEKEFKNRGISFRDKFSSLTLPAKSFKSMGEDRIGFRCTLIPINGNIKVSNIYKLFDKITFVEKLKVSFESGNPKEDELGFPSVSLRKYPIIRGVRFWDDNIAIELAENGLIEIHFIYCRDIRDYFHISWYLMIIYNGISLSNRICEILSRFNIEYGIEAELISTEGYINPYLFESNYGSERKVVTPILFPRYSYANDREINDLLNLMIEDFYNMCEIPFNNSVKVI